MWQWWHPRSLFVLCWHWQPCFHETTAAKSLAPESARWALAFSRPTGGGGTEFLTAKEAQLENSKVVNHRIAGPTLSSTEPSEGIVNILHRQQSHAVTPLTRDFLFRELGM